MSDQVQVGEWTGDMYTATEWMSTALYDTTIAEFGDSLPDQEFVDAYCLLHRNALGRPFTIPLCSADEDGCHSGPEYGPCASCQKYIDDCMKRAAAEYRVAPMSKTDPKRYREGLIEAGRGHLVRER